MKNILRDSLGRFKSLNVNLLDGQRKGEVVFRRVFILLVGALLVYLLLLAFVGRKDQNVEVVDAKETTEYKDGDIVNGQVVDIDENGKVWYIYDYKEPETKKANTDKVAKYIKSYKGEISDKYLKTLREYCDEDTLKLVVAISVAETSMGKNTNNDTNFFGYFYGGDRQYDPSMKEMSRVICNGIGKYYSDVATNVKSAQRYTGGDNVKTWMKNVNIALGKMK